MMVGLFHPRGLPESFRVCIDNITAELERLGVTVVPFESRDAIPPDVDIFWDPRSGGGNPPAAFVRNATKPCVVTVHGVGPLEVPEAYEEGLFGRYRIRRDNRVKRRAWSRIAPHCAALVAVSRFGKSNLVHHLGLDPATIYVCPNAVNHGLFRPMPTATDGPRYMLHISNDEPRKNVDRIIAAYHRLDVPDKPELWLKLPRRTRRIAGDGVRVIAHRAGDREIASLYNNAMAFIFPSLYEGFGLPILEAMASACPVITANGSACAEVAAAAAITVNPRSVDAVADAMHTVCTSVECREDLVRRGLERAREFTWEKTSRQYLAVFRHVARAQHIR